MSGDVGGKGLSGTGLSGIGLDGTVMVSVRGEATVDADPELCEIAVIVEAREKEKRATLEKLTELNTETLAAIKAYGDAVEKVETSGFSVYPVQSGKSRADNVRAYAGSVRIRVVVNDFTVVGELVGKMADADGRSVQGPYWQLRRDSEVYRRVRTQAVTEAVTRAREYTGALGSTLTGLVELADSGMSTSDSNPMPQMRMMAMATSGRGGGMSEPPALDLEPVRQSVYASIEARFTATQPAEL